MYLHCVCPTYTSSNCFYIGISWHSCRPAIGHKSWYYTGYSTALVARDKRFCTSAIHVCYTINVIYNSNLGIALLSGKGQGLNLWHPTQHMSIYLARSLMEMFKNKMIFYHHVPAVDRMYGEAVRHTKRQPGYSW